MIATSIHSICIIMAISLGGMGGLQAMRTSDVSGEEAANRWAWAKGLVFSGLFFAAVAGGVSPWVETELECTTEMSG